MPHATEADYLAWAGEPLGDGAVRILELASLAVDAELVRNPTVDPDTGDPIAIPADHAEALRKATCAQAWMLSEHEGLERWTSVSLGPLSLGTSADAVEDMPALSPAARAYLHRAGLLYRGAVSANSYPYAYDIDRPSGHYDHHEVWR